MKIIIYYSMALATIIYASVGLAKMTIVDIKIEERMLASELCKKMSRFDPSHVHEFFSKSLPISAVELHEFNQLDCHIKGSLTRDKSRLNFDIQPIGVGRLINKKTGQIEMYGCKTCDHLFPPVD